jgi:hypothetical protein
MSLLTVVQDVCDVIGLTRPAAVVSSTDPLARQALGLAKETLRELSRMDWPALEVPYTFDTVVDQESYDFPADYATMTADTVYSSTQYYNMRGSLGPGEWTKQRNALAADTGRSKFRIFGTPLKLYITPTPSSVESVTMEYKTTNWVKQVDNSYKTTFYADTDVTVAPEELLYSGLMWRLRRAKGLDYSEEFDAYEKARTQLLAQHLSFGTIPVAYRNGVDTPPLTNGYIPENGFG